MNKAINIKLKKHYYDFECKIDEIYKKHENLFAKMNLKSEDKKQKMTEKFMQLCAIGKESCVKDIREAIKKFEKRNPKIRLKYP